MGQTNAKEATGLDGVPLKEIDRAFRKYAHNNQLTQERFQNALAELEAHGLKKITGTPLAERLFFVFDSDRSGSVDVAEFLSGVAFLSSGSSDTKAELTFKCYDSDGSGYVEEKEVIDMAMKSYDIAAKSALAVESLEKLGGMDKAIVSDGREQVRQNMLQDLAKIKKESPGKLNLQEFKLFCQGMESIYATIYGSSAEVSIVI